MNPQTFWENFSLDYRLDESCLSSLLDEIDSHEEKLEELRVDVDCGDWIYDLNSDREAEATFSLEGESSILQEQRNGYRDAFQWMDGRFMPGAEAIGLDDILNVHRLLTEEYEIEVLRADWKENGSGRLRQYTVDDVPRYEKVYFGAPHKDLSWIMKKFEDFLSADKLREEHPVVQAMLVHSFLSIIQPFNYDNGTVARLVANAILRQNGHHPPAFFGLSDFFYRDAKEYETVLRQPMQTEFPLDFTVPVAYGVTGYLLELRTTVKYLTELKKQLLYEKMLAACRDRKVSPHRLLLNGKEYELLKAFLLAMEPEGWSMEFCNWGEYEDALMRYQPIKSLYADAADKTFSKDLARLQGLGFIKTDMTEDDRAYIEIDFTAIKKYPLS